MPNKFEIEPTEGCEELPLPGHNLWEKDERGFSRYRGFIANRRLGTPEATRAANRLTDWLGAGIANEPEPLAPLPPAL